MALLERSQRTTVASALAARAASDPEHEFLRSPSGTLTYGDVETQSESLAAALSHLGIEAGDRIALVLPACPEFAVAFFAVAKLGGVAVPLDPRLTGPDLQYMLRHSQAVCAVTIEETDGVDFLELFEELQVGLPELQYLVTVGEEDLWYDDRIFQFEDLVSAGEGREYPAPSADGDDACFAIVYTSGTTGKPKGVELSHRNLVATAAGTAEALGLGAGDRVVGISALYHVFGVASGLLAAALAGGALVLRDGSDPDAVLDLVEGHGATVLHGVPTTFVGVLAAQRARPRDVSSLRLAVVAGAPTGDELVRAVEEALSVRMTVAYSLSEAASTVSVSRADDPAEKRAFTVGRPLPGTELRILEADGAALPVESVGEIAVRGPGVMSGYHRQPRETAATFDDDGFLLTGDLGMMDEDGFLHLVGRRKEVIIRSGFNVYPREVETRLEAHPAVREVAVVGVPDPLLGEAICACVVPEEGAIVTDDEIVDWCRDTLAATKLPDLVRFMDALPRTGTGKVRRVELTRTLQSDG